MDTGKEREREEEIRQQKEANRHGVKAARARRHQK
jgi:hypothetical protein